MKTSLIFCLLTMFSFVRAQSCIGLWRTIDDESKEAKSHVEVFERGGFIYGQVKELLPSAKTRTCNNCPGDKLNKPLIGMEIMWNLKSYKDYWSYGEILDPKSGKIYKCSIWLEGPDRLHVRGYIGVSALGRTQIWERVKS